MIKIAIVENDDKDRTLLSESVKNYFKGKNDRDYSLDLFHNALQFLSSPRDYDLSFLDILRPHRTGWELSKKIREQNPKRLLVFTTNLTNYAIKGYEVDALDYLVKPVNKDHLFRLMDKAEGILSANKEAFITLKNKTSRKVVPLSAIAYIESHAHEIQYHFVDGSDFSVWGTLKDERTRIPEKKFVRISSSQVVNRSKIRSISNSEVTLDRDKTLYRSRLYKSAASQKILSYFGSRS